MWSGCAAPTGNDSNPVLAVSPDSLEFGETRESMTLTLINAGNGVLDWRIAIPSVGWISVSQVNGSVVKDPVAIDVRLDRDQAPPGEHRIALVILSGEGGRHEVTLKAFVHDRSPVLQVDPNSLDFGESNSSAVLIVSNTGGG
jgi:hypothetical protein